MKITPGRETVTRYRIVARKPGETEFKWVRFPGSQVTGDKPLAYENLARARRDTPQWEFALASQEVVTVTHATSWVVGRDAKTGELL